jgi:hypothetical protein
MKRITTSLVCAVSLLLAAASAIAQPSDATGYLFVPDYIQGDQGTRPPMTIREAETGVLMPLETVSPSLTPGQQFALPEGWYHVEIGQFESKGNIRAYRIKAGRVTVVKVGLVTVRFPIDATKVQFCPGWSHNLTAYARDWCCYKPVASDVSLDASRYSVLQLHEGKYLLEWNRLHIPITIKAGEELVIEPVVMEPFGNVMKPRLSEPLLDGMATRGTVFPCPDKPLYLFPGTYTLSHRVKINTYPYYEVAQDQVTVEGKKDLVRTRPLPKLEGKAKLYKGDKGRGEQVPPRTPEGEKPHDHEEPPAAPAPEAAAEPAPAPEGDAH